MKEKIVRYDASSLPRLTDQDLAELRKLAERPDSEIDFSDIPEITHKQWEAERRKGLYRSVTLEIDADVLAWLKSKGKGYQSRMNEILRMKMLEDMKG